MIAGPLILASKSASRRMMLDAAGIHYESRPADLDEREIEARLGDSHPSDVAIALAEAKAIAVSNDAPERLVLGSDSLVDLGGKRFDKPANRAEARVHLAQFSGRTMHLHSAAALARNGAIAWSGAAMASLAFRPLSDAEIEAYLDEEWPAVAGCVGVFRIEGPGVRLFRAIEGDQFTVMGMPLLQVCQALRREGHLPW